MFKPRTIFQTTLTAYPAQMYVQLEIELAKK